MNATKVKFLLSGGAFAIGLGLVVLFFFAPDQYPFYPRCLFHTVTGLQCPGCGGLRAMHCLLHGQFVAAFHLNALFVLLLPIALLIGVRLTLNPQSWLPKMLQASFWWWLLLSAVILFGIGRNL